MDSINISWFTGEGGKNWGDALSPLLSSLISGKDVNHINPWDNSNTFRYYVIGSIIPPSSPNSEIWGSGIIKETNYINVIPKKIHSVRGPLTREIFLKNGIDCPEVYGDPALLYPRFYNPKIEKKYKYGVIPHYVDQNSPWVNKQKERDDVLIINILDPINKVVDDIKQCEIILSSTLHGIICADSYNIPSYWVELSDKVIGDGFKFRDYFLSVGRPIVLPLKPHITSKIEDMSPNFFNYNIDINLDKLYDSCPFKK